MSIELELHCKLKPRVSSIEQLIKPFGWEIWYERGHSSYFFRYESENYESTTGCWLYLQKPDKFSPKGTKIVFQASSPDGRSYEDLEAQNKIIRLLKEKYGGVLFNSQEGTRSYIVNDIAKLSASEKACGFSYISFQRNLQRIRSTLDFNKKQPNLPIKDYESFHHFIDTKIISTNTLIPFLISCFEAFLKDFFVTYVDTNKSIQEKFFNSKEKLSPRDLKDILNKNLSIGQLISNSYKFQNLDSSNAAYNNYLDFDLLKALGKKKKIRKKLYRINNLIREILNFRHKIVHEAYLDSDLNDGVIELYVSCLEMAGKLIVENFLNEKNFKIDLEGTL